MAEEKTRTIEYQWNVVKLQLPTAAGHLLMVTALVADDDGLFYTSRAYLARATGMSKTKAQRWMSWLEGRRQKSIPNAPPRPPLVRKTGANQGLAHIRRLGGAICPRGGAGCPGRGGRNEAKGGAGCPPEEEEKKKLMNETPFEEWFRTFEEHGLDFEEWGQQQQRREVAK